MLPAPKPDRRLAPESLPFRARAYPGRDGDPDPTLRGLSEPLVTVVTPVYNGEEHLAECMESVVGQTYANWEYVVVDNCSKDRTPEIVERFARSEPRIRYERHEEFVDVVRSHNRSFRSAVGPDSVYCKVVGADDWLYPECLSRMVEVAERHPDVGVVGSYRLAGSRVDLAGIPYGESTEPGRSVVAKSLQGSGRRRLVVTGSPSALLLRSRFVRARDPFYDETMRHADTDAAYWVLMQSDFGFVHQVLTFFRESERSESSVSGRLGSWRPELIRRLLRYGPSVLSPEDYRRELRNEVETYARWFLRYRIRRHRQRDIWDYQRHAVELMKADVGDDVESQRAFRILRLLTRW